MRRYGGIPKAPPPARNPASILQVFMADMIAWNVAVQRQIETAIDWAFSFTRRGGQWRWYAFLAVSVLLWISIAFVAHPLGRSNAPVTSQLFTALFAKDVLRRFLLLGLALWLSLRLAAIYLDDIFELEDTGLAERFLRQAAFASQYPVIRIQDGEVNPQQQKSPVIQIGGPGRVDVHLENAAMFEKADGTPHVIRPTLKSTAILEGFERLRKIINLKEQVLELTVESRTQDGIPVVAKDVRLVFSVYRGSGQPAPELQQPYPFDEQVIHALVYKQGDGSWINAARGLIRSELGNFISRHTLNEFLANGEGQAEPGRFISREEITDLFYNFTQGFARRARENGIQLTWIGLGTWVTPSEIIPEQHLEAWKLSSDNRVKGSEASLRSIRNESRVAELMRIVDQVPAAYYQMIQEDLPPDQIMRRLILLYREKLRLARGLYEEHNQPVPPELDAVIKNLNRLAAVQLSGSGERTDG